MKKRLELTDKKKRVAKRRYVLKAEQAILDNKEVLDVMAVKMQERGWYSKKTSISDIIFSIFRYMEINAKRRHKGQWFREVAIEKGLFLYWRKERLQHMM